MKMEVGAGWGCGEAGLLFGTTWLWENLTWDHKLPKRNKGVKWVRKRKKILYITIYMWNLEKWYRWNYLQSRNKHTDVENKYMNTKGRIWGWDELGEWDWHIYTAMHGREITREEPAMCRELNSVLCGDLDGILLYFTVQEKLAKSGKQFMPQQVKF